MFWYQFQWYQFPRRLVWLTGLSLINNKSVLPIEQLYMWWTSLYFSFCFVFVLFCLFHLFLLFSCFSSSSCCSCCCVCVCVVLFLFVFCCFYLFVCLPHFPLSSSDPQTKPATPSSSTSTTTSTGEGSALAGSGGTSSFGQDPLPRGPRAVRPAPAPPGQASHGRSPPRNSLNTADAAGEDDGDGDSSALTHNKAWSHSTRSYHSGSTLCSQGEERLGAASSFSAHPASPRQHHHHHHRHNHSHSHHQQQRVCRGDGGDSGVAGVGEGRGEVAARGARAVPLSSAFSASHIGAAAYCEPSASAQEFLARLQVRAWFLTTCLHQSFIRFPWCCITWCFCCCCCCFSPCCTKWTFDCHFLFFILSLFCCCCFVVVVFFCFSSEGPFFTSPSIVLVDGLGVKNQATTLLYLALI